MQADYCKKQPTPHWDRVHTVYPTRKFPSTTISSKAIGHEWRNPAEVLQTFLFCDRLYICELKVKNETFNELTEYDRNFMITNQLTRSLTREHYGSKLPDTNRFNKHTSCIENEYIYPLTRNLSENPPLRGVHGTTEMRSSYCTPSIPSRLITNKDQYKRISSSNRNELQEPSFHKALPPLDTTHDGYEKYLDPYLTTSRLEHRPFTAQQLSRPSNTKDAVTFYSFANVPWTRTPEPNLEHIRVPLSRPKSMYDRNTFKQDVREIRIRNKLFWVPGSFQTESNANFTPVNSRPQSKIQNMENEVRNIYSTKISRLPIFEDHMYPQSTENSHYGSRKPLCTIFDQFVERNKRLERKS